MRNYPEYIDSGIEWIREIPKNWQLKKMKHFCSLKSGNGFSHDLQGRAGLEVPFFKVSDTNTPVNKVDMLYAQNTVSSQEVHDFKFTLHRPKSIVFPKIGAALLLNKRNIIVNDSCIDNNMMSLSSNQSNHKFLYYAMLNVDFERHYRGGGTVPSINESEVGDILIAYPTLSEQHAIATFLDRKTGQIDELIRAKERKIELLGEYRASLINQAVTKGLDPNVEMKSSGVEWIGKIPKHWAISKVKHELESLDHMRVPLNSETRGSMKSKVYDYYGASGVIDKVETYIFNEPLILIGEDGANLYLRSTPLAFKATGKYWVNNHAHVLKPRHGNIDYLTNMLQSLDYTHYISGAAQPKLTAGRLMNISVVIPPLSEQIQIADFINHKTKQIDELHSNEEQTIKLLKEYRQSLISEVVTGKIDVRGEV